MKIVELDSSGVHISDDEQRPSITEDLRCFGDRAVLTIGVHQLKMRLIFGRAVRY